MVDATELAAARLAQADRDAEKIQSQKAKIERLNLSLWEITNLADQDGARMKKIAHRALGED